MHGFSTGIFMDDNKTHIAITKEKVRSFAIQCPAENLVEILKMYSIAEKSSDRCASIIWKRRFPG